MREERRFDARQEANRGWAAILDIKWLNDFMTVAEMGNFTRAAESRHTSQAAFSRRIQALESWLGTTLVDRAVFPTRLTPKGERFREYAGDILRSIEDARGELSGDLKPDHIRIAIPYALATSSLPHWWAEWAEGMDFTCSVVVGNVHDMMTALASGGVDVLICFQTPQQPIQFDTDRYEKFELRCEMIKPYASKVLIDKGLAVFPGRHEQPMPLLMYTPGVYLGRMVDMLIEAAPQKLIGRRVIESDMSDVLRGMAVNGFGIAWLGESTAKAGGGLIEVGDKDWSTSLSTMAIRSSLNERAATHRLWARMKAGTELSGMVPAEY